MILSTDGQTDGRTRWNQYTHPPFNFIEAGGITRAHHVEEDRLALGGATTGQETNEDDTATDADEDVRRLHVVDAGQLDVDV